MAVALHECLYSVMGGRGGGDCGGWLVCYRKIAKSSFDFSLADFGSVRDVNRPHHLARHWPPLRDVTNVSDKRALAKRYR